MKYSLFFNILFMGLCGVYAKDRHIRDIPQDGRVFGNKTDFLARSDPNLIFDPNNCPVPPLDCPNDNITFWYYSRAIGEHPLPIRFAKARSTGLKTDPGPWKLILHGFTESKETFPVHELVSAYNNKGDYNILVVDFYELVKPGCLEAAVKNIPLISKCTANMLDFLTDTKVLLTEELHVIGFDLGAQIAGSISEYLRRGALGRVTALDPYNIMISVIPFKSLGIKSALFVDVYHTNAVMRNLIPAKAHIEFFFNGGFVQRDCYKEGSGLLQCSHEKSVKFFIESIEHAGTEKGFYGVPCEDYWWFATLICKCKESQLVKAGEDIRLGARGVYQVQTRNEPPYSLGKLTHFNVDLMK